ncbi:hypothetical protein [Demetria terragena]|uniref:hypothetical protein n=1 Tax=Demetria terragena TaxID=63959 RepID=UPI0012EA3040|nr:hypothetical protein [Demetria terragena]
MHDAINLPSKVFGVEADGVAEDEPDVDGVGEVCVLDGDPLVVLVELGGVLVEVSEVVVELDEVFEAEGVADVELDGVEVALGSPSSEQPARKTGKISATAASCRAGREV